MASPEDQNLKEQLSQSSENESISDHTEIVTGVEESRAVVLEALEDPLSDYLCPILSVAQQSLSIDDYINLEKEVNSVKERGMNVDGIEAQMPELLEKVLRKELISRLSIAQESLNIDDYMSLKKGLDSVKARGVNVYDIESQMPELLKKIFPQEIEGALAKAQKSLEMSDYRNLKYTIDRAKELEVDVYDIETQITELLEKVLRKQLELSLDKVQKSLEMSDYRNLKYTIDRAKKLEVDVSDIETQISELLEKLFDKELELRLTKVQNSLEMSDYLALNYRVEEATDMGVNVSDIKTQISTILKRIPAGEIGAIYGDSLLINEMLENGLYEDVRRYLEEKIDVEMMDKFNKLELSNNRVMVLCYVNKPLFNECVEFLKTYPDAIDVLIDLDYTGPRFEKFISEIEVSNFQIVLDALKDS